MSPNFAPSTATATLPKTFDQRMKLYSVAAAAAGVTVLALAQPSDAEVVITRKTIALTPVINTSNSVSIDINRDGIPDFAFSITDYQYHSLDARIAITPLQGGAVVGVPGQHAPFYASALGRGAKIGPSANFSSKGFAEVERSFIPYIPSQYKRYVYGKWGGSSSNRYVGIRFLIKGETHYGWVRLSVSSTSYPMSGTITGYAYETVPNKRILAGISTTSAAEAKAEVQVPSSGASLGVLAVGADGVAMWRREEISGY